MKEKERERKEGERTQSLSTHQLLFMLVRIYDLEPLRAGGVIHVRSSQKEKAGGALMDI